jgi:aminopeptidase N
MWSVTSLTCRSWRHVQKLATAAYPQYAVVSGTLLLADRLLERDDLHPALRRTVVDRTDDLRRALVARERFA